MISLGGALTSILVRNENGPFAARIKNHVDRLAQTRMDILDEGSRKRGPPVEPTDGLDNAKRMRLGAEMPSQSNHPPLPSGPVSVAQLFTLSGDEGLTSFDVTQLPIELVVKITLPVLHQINQAALDNAINSIRSRYLSLSKVQQAIPTSQPAPQNSIDDEEDDYEPDFQPMEDTEQILNKADDFPSEDAITVNKDLALGPFKLPQPPPFTTDEVYKLGKSTVSRVFGMMSALEEPNAVKRPKPGLNRLAGSNYDQEAWITIIARLATRSSQDWEDENPDSDLSKSVNNKEIPPTSINDTIRENLWKYIVEDFRSRLHIAILWLNEEWFNDRIQGQVRNSRDIKSSLQPLTPHYDKWVIKVLDVIIPYLDAKDKLLIRFLSEIPAIDGRILERVKGLARDPERVVLAVNAIQYVKLHHNLLFSTKQ